MKYLKQFLIISFICLVGELLAYFLPLPIPASVYGMVLLFFLLLTKVIKVSQVEDISSFFASIMPVFFISPSVKIITAWDLLADHLVAILLMAFVSTMVVTIITGLTAQGIIRSRRGDDKKTDMKYDSSENKAIEVSHEL